MLNIAGSGPALEGSRLRQRLSILFAPTGARFRPLAGPENRRRAQVSTRFPPALVYPRAMFPLPAWRGWLALGALALASCATRPLPKYQPPLPHTQHQTVR